MATATLALTILVPPVTDKGQTVVRGTLAITGADYASGGLILPLNLAAIPTRSLPVMCRVWGQAGYQYSFIKGTTLANGKVSIRAQTNAAAEDDALGELAVAALPAGVTGDVINFEGIFVYGD